MSTRTWIPQRFMPGLGNPVRRLSFHANRTEVPVNRCPEHLTRPAVAPSDGSKAGYTAPLLPWRVDKIFEKPRAADRSTCPVEMGDKNHPAWSGPVLSQHAQLTQLATGAKTSRTGIKSPNARWEEKVLPAPARGLQGPARQLPGPLEHLFGPDIEPGHLPTPRALITAAASFSAPASTSGCPTHPSRVFHRVHGRPLAFAGLWERWEKGGEPVESFTILTTKANELMGPFHGRIPVIVARSDFDRWLRGGDRPLLRPCPAAALRAYPGKHSCQQSGARQPGLPAPGGMTDPLHAPLRQ
jgi:hypothetical protein